MTAEIEELPEQAYLYVIGAEDGPQKIGIARDPGKRLANLQIGSPTALAIRLTVPFSREEIRAIERCVHMMLNSRRAFGEWFNITPEEVAEVAIQAAKTVRSGWITMPLPTMSLRVAEEHQQLIRDIGAALRTRPELVDVLRDVLHSQDAIRDTGVLQAFQERLTIQSEGFQRLMAFAENINERVKALELPDALRNTDGNTDVLQSILGRLAALEDLVTGPQAALLNSGNSEVRPRPPRPAAAPKPSGQGRRSPRPWTDADDAELRRIFDQGRTQADACREMDRPSSVISPKWRKFTQE